MEKIKVLIVDDNINNSRLIEGILNVDERDFQCFFAENGLEAYEKAKEIFPDLILMDLLMPDVDGLESLRMIQKHTELRETPVIFITASARTPISAVLANSVNKD